MWLKGYKSSFINLGHKCDLLRTVENSGACLQWLRSGLWSIQLGWISWSSVMTLKISGVTCTGQWCLHLWGEKSSIGGMAGFSNYPILMPGWSYGKWKVAFRQNVIMADMVASLNVIPHCLPHSASFQASGTLIWFQYR